MWKTDPGLHVCIWWRGGGGACWWMMNQVCTQLKVRTLLLLPWVYEHKATILCWQINYFDLRTYIVHGVWYASYIITHSSNSTLLILVLLDLPDSLLQINYLQSIIFAHACLFIWPEMALSVKSFLNYKFS